MPPGIATTETFLDGPAENLDWLSRAHFTHFGGPLLLLAGCILAPLISRRREVVMASVVTVICVVLWTNAPFTGGGELKTFGLGTVRYLLPPLACAAAGLALASRDGGWRGALVTVLLAVALTLDLVQGYTELGDPSLVPIGDLAPAALIGATLAGLAGLLGATPRATRALAVAGGATLAVATGLMLAMAAPGYWDRHSTVGERPDFNLLHWFAAEPDYARGEVSVVGMGLRPGILAGPRLQHDVSFVARAAPCPAVRRHTRPRMWSSSTSSSRRAGSPRANNACPPAARPRSRAPGSASIDRLRPATAPAPAQERDGYQGDQGYG